MTSIGFVSPLYVKKKLFTKEDPHYLHKTLGLLCVLSFFFRYQIDDELHFFDGRHPVGLDVLTFLLHLGLSSSSLIFHVLKKRIADKPLIIWEEYRLHAIIFTSRSFCIGMISGLWPSMPKLVPFIVLTVHHLVVDYVTKIHGREGTTTVRNEGKVRPTLKAGFLFYSYYQFAASASNLAPSAYTPALAFNTIIAIQSSSFLMTLCRKSIIDWYTHAALYTACLLLSLARMAAVFNPLFFATVAFLFALRVVLRLDKYLIWTVFSGIALMYPTLFTEQLSILS
mmetsp:Transcript_6156/g.20105  ORF Transcript_6156/g.20105 Transcript_6156/m.20105 type:complete len:283 (-) Transcript_6156:28-876(-)